MNNSADMGDRRPGKSCPYDNYKGSSLLLASGAACDKLVADCMARHKTQADFLKALIAYEDSDCSHQLQASLAKADHESKCVRCTMFVMLMLLLLSLAGLSFCAILLPRVFSDSTHVAMTSLSIFGLASAICLLELTGYLLWHRFALGRLHKECRRSVMLFVEPHIRPRLPPNPSVDGRRESGPSLARGVIRQREELSPRSL